MRFTLLGNNSIHFKKQASIIVGLFFLCFIFQSCGDNDSVVASVGETELLESEVSVLMKHAGLDAKDTVQLKQFVREWCHGQLYIEELKSKYPERWKLIAQRTNLFAGTLAKFEIEQIEINSKLNQEVSEQEIVDYYEGHKSEFILQDYLVKGLYLKIPKEVDFRTKKINLHYLLKNDKDLVQVDSYAKLYAENYYYNVNDWIFFNELLKDVPVKKYNRDNIVLNRSKTYFSDDEYTYFINIVDFKLKDEVSPLEFLKDDIKEIILATRLKTLVEKNTEIIKEKIKTEHEVIINI